MLSIGHHLKIPRAVIKSIAIDVMHHFIGCQCSTENLFHCLSMLADQLTVDLKSAVSIASNCAFAFLSDKADIGITMLQKSRIMHCAKSATLISTSTAWDGTCFGQAFSRRLNQLSEWISGFTDALVMHKAKSVAMMGTLAVCNDARQFSFSHAVDYTLIEYVPGT